MSRAVRCRPDAARTRAVLSVVSLCVLVISIVWGLFGATRHGVPPVEIARPTVRGALP